MRRAQQKRAARSAGGHQARQIVIPLPVNGMLHEANTAEVRGIYAGELLNWRSTGASLRLRPPHSQVSVGEQALQRIAFEYGAFQEYITVTETAISASDIAFERACDRPFQTAFISSNAVMVDGNGDPVLFNGQAFSTGAFSPNTALTADQFDGVVAHQDRLFFWKTGDALDFYYGGVGAITGPLTRFPLGRLGNIRGSILALASITVDAGEDINDTLAIFTTTGDIVIYQGLNPGDANDWRLVTRITAAPPLSKDAFLRVGSDLWMLCNAGIVSITQTIRDSSLALVNTVSRPIQEKLVEQIAEGGEWSLHMQADARAIFIQRMYRGCPSQFIYGTDTQSWREADIPARQWHNIGKLTQFTTLGGFLGTLDGKGIVPVTARWTSSWFRLPRATGISFIRPTIKALGPLQVKITILSDHDGTGVDIAEAEQVITIEPDDAMDSAAKVALNERIAVDAVGEVFQIRMEVSAKWAEIVSVTAGVL